MNYSGLDDLRVLSRADHYNRWKTDLIRPYVGERILDAGAGVGTFSIPFQDREKVVLVDIADNCLIYLAEKFLPKKNFEVWKLDVSDQHDMNLLKDKKFDTVIAIDLLEHLEDDELALENFHNLLRSGGNIVLMVPAFSGLYGSLDRHFEHHRRYSKREIVNKLRKAGFTVKNIRYYNSLGFFAWFLFNKIFKVKNLSHGIVGFYNRAVVKFLSVLERIISPPFGLGFMVVGEKW